jgi:6-phosphogluconate dehydrogenase
MKNQGCDIGLIGLGVMGRNLVLNMADQGFLVAVYNRTTGKTREFIEKEIGSRDIRGGYNLKEFTSLLRKPRAILLLVKAGPPVDAVIEELLSYLEPGDLLIDGGNSYFRDTNRRSKSLAEKGFLYLGMGISGGEYGARHGPSMMPGGSKEAYERVLSILEATAAKVDGEPCVTFLGFTSAGHYVKMVHNGIEYGLMELIAETYDLMKRGLGLTNDELHVVYNKWNQGELKSYLIEITAQIFLQRDDKTDKRLIDMILDEAKQKGTGKWTSWGAMDLQVPTPTVDTAVMMRDLSGYKVERKIAAQMIHGPKTTFKGDRDRLISQLRNALYASMIITYTQGMALLKQASNAYGYGLNLEAVARIWRGGCIIRAALLEDIRTSYQKQPGLVNLLMDPHLSEEVMARQGDLREVVSVAANLGLPAPGLMVSLAYFDGYRSAWLPANLMQAQRDYFGAHTYERVDKKGVFHTQWGQS